MCLAARRAAPAAVIVACALAAPAARAAEPGDRLVGQLAQVVAQSPDAGLPQLSPGPPTPFGTPAPAPTASPTATATSGSGGEDLPRTGSDAAPAALAGLGLLGIGLSLRRLTHDGAED